MKCLLREDGMGLVRYIRIYIRIYVLTYIQTYVYTYIHTYITYMNT
jgi:hypothetical protein